MFALLINTHGSTECIYIYVYAHCFLPKNLPKNLFAVEEIEMKMMLESLQAKLSQIKWV